MVDVKEVRAATPAEWDDAWRYCPYATYFHSRQWAEIWADYQDRPTLTPASVVIRFSDDREIVLVLTAERRRRGFPPRFLSAPAGTYGGWLAPEPLEPPHIHCIQTYIDSHVPDIQLRQNPFDPGVSGLSNHPWWTREDFTQVIDYSHGMSTILDVLRQNQILRKARQGERAGLAIRKSTEEETITKYSDVYAACQERWGASATSNYHPRLFRSLQLESQNVDFWVVEQDGQFIGGGPFLKSPDFHVVSWLALADPSLLRLKPYEFLYVKLIEHYGDQGYRFFDFNPSGGHQGVVDFKASFGASRLPACLLITKSLRYKAASSPYRILKRTASLAKGMGVDRWKS